MLEFVVNKDESEESLRSLLEAHISYERMKARRLFCVHALALVSVVVWLRVCWPSLLPAPVQDFVKEFWGILFFVLIVVSATEWKRRQRLARCVARHAGAKLH